VVLQALAALFMMNNIHHMVKTVESSATLMLLGQEWLEHRKARSKPPRHGAHNFSPLRGDQ